MSKGRETRSYGEIVSRERERKRIKSILKTDAHVPTLWRTIELNLAGLQRQPDNYVTWDF